jgi:predicted dehydrogenase
MTGWKRKLRMGMVGGGQGAFIGAVHRIAATMDGQAELVAGCFSRDHDNTIQTGKRLYLNPERCYATYEAMAAGEAALPESERIDFVAVVTPTVSHFDIVEKFLTSGFHVVCDKPMTYSVAEAEKLADLVKGDGLVLAVTQNYTGYPLVREARQLVRQGEIGTIRKVIVEYLQDFLMLDHEKQGNNQAIWRLDPAQVGLAGTMGEAGIHAFHLLEYITLDPIVELCADRTTFLPDRVLEEDANILLRFGGGGKGVLTVSQIAAGEENNLNIRVYGSKGSLVWHQENPNSLELYRYGRPRQTLRAGHGEYLSSSTTAATRVPSGHPEGYIEAFANIYAGAFDAIRRHIDGIEITQDGETAPTVTDGLRGLRLVAGAVKSCNSGSIWVSVR